MPTQRRPHRTTDLFELFPDLPWARRRTTADKQGHIHQQVELVHDRTELSIVRQRTVTEGVRAGLARFWRRT
jgi:hypothetical protein